MLGSKGIVVKCTAAIFFRTADWPVKREIRNSFKFRRVGPARWWHDTLRPLVRITRFLPASWSVQRSSVEVTSRFQPLPPLLVAVDVVYPHHSVRLLSWWSRFPPITRDLTIWQRRRPWKPRWKIDAASFQTISRLSQVARYLKEGNLCWSWREGSHPSSDRDDIIYRLAVPVLKKA